MGTNEKRPSLAYWIPTILIALLWTFGGANALLRTESSVEVIRRLGYPAHFLFSLLALTMLSASYRAWRRRLGEAAA